MGMPGTAPPAPGAGSGPSGSSEAAGGAYGIRAGRSRPGFPYHEGTRRAAHRQLKGGLVDGPAPINDERLRECLREVFDAHGAPGLDDPERLRRELPDRLAGDERGILPIVEAASLGAARLLKQRVEQGLTTAAAVRDVTASLLQRSALDPAACAQIISV